MVRSWSMGNSGSRGARRRLGRRLGLRRGSLGASRRAQEQKAQQELAQLGQSGILARLLVQEAALLPLSQALLAGLLPGWLPLIVTDGGAQSQQRIDMRALEAACRPL